MPGRRNPKWIALGIVALCLGGLLSYVIYARVATETTVVAMASTVYRGEVIEQDDLTTITLRAGSIAQAVPASDLDTMIGKRAAVDLVEGSVVIDHRDHRPRQCRRRAARSSASSWPPAERPTSLLVPVLGGAPGRPPRRDRLGQARRRHLHRVGSSTRRPAPTAPRSWSTSTSPPTRRRPSPCSPLRTGSPSSATPGGDDHHGDLDLDLGRRLARRDHPRRRSGADLAAPGPARRLRPRRTSGRPGRLPGRPVQPRQGTAAGRRGPSRPPPAARGGHRPMPAARGRGR